MACSPPRLPATLPRMRIAVAGKGGSGKTTIAGTLARLLARRQGGGVLAIDADSNPNLALTLGLTRNLLPGLPTLGSGATRRELGADGKARTVLARPVADLLSEYAVATPDGVRLVLMGRVEHAGVG
jgi:CO dehydrogenase maturation factor